MSTSANKTNNEMRIPGAALASTIKVLAGLGLWERVLKSTELLKLIMIKSIPVN